MDFNPDPEAMAENGQQWFDSDYNRLRWWVGEGSYVVVRPDAPAGLCAEAGLDRDVLWTALGHLDHNVGNPIFAEWVVSRPDIGVSVTGTKLEVALNGFYDRLAESACAGSEGTVRDALGRDAMDGLKAQFSSRSPRFKVLSDMGKAPIVRPIDDAMNDVATACENINPMKRSVFYKDRVNGA